MEVSTADYLEYNAMVGVTFLGWVESDSAYRVDYGNVTIVNYFSPEVLDVVVSGPAAAKTIRWTIYDRNALETHSCEVLISLDGGASCQPLVADLISTEYTWDSSGFFVRQYVAMVRVSDSHGDTGIGLSDPFPAGTLHTGGPIPTTVTSSDTTTDSATQGIMTQLGITITLASLAVILTALVLWRQSKTRSMGPQ